MYLTLLVFERLNCPCNKRYLKIKLQFYPSPRIGTHLLFAATRLEQMEKNKNHFGASWTWACCIDIFYCNRALFNGDRRSYGDNQNFFYESKVGDTAVNRGRKEFKKVEKSWKKVFVADERGRVDIWKWLNEDSVEVYRDQPFVYDKEPSYNDIQRLVSEDKLELVIENWRRRPAATKVYAQFEFVSFFLKKI